ncbi:MAG: serine/threonine protein kinase [Archangiaceae bacterium]|nr:serine/threonine protein kinase [Archangiaceae bacterium]
MSMMRPDASCPSDAELEAHLAAPQLSERGSALIAHTEACAACRARVGQLLRRVSLDSLATGPAEPEGAVEELVPGLCFGEYVLVEPLGTGANARVYLAQHPQLMRQVALKLILLPRDSAARAHTIARAVREGRALAKLDHPNVVTVHAVGEAHGYAWVAMELVKGGTLREWAASAARSTRRDVQRLLQTLLQAGQGLAAAHHSGLVHRDFKPDNVLVSEAGVARVTDFGLARPTDAAETGLEAGPALEPHGTDALVTREGAVVGTPAYMAPELLGGETATALSDQFSFCVTALECLYGERPFEPRTQGQHRWERGPLRRPPAKSPVPRAVHRLLVRGLAERPEQRHGSLAALLVALERYARPRSAARVAVAAVATLAAVGAALVLATAPGRREAALCEQSTRWSGVWDAPRRAEVRQAFEQSGLPFSTAAFEQLAAWLDGYTSQWSDTQRQVCLASSVSQVGDRSYELLCLHQRRQEVVELVAALGHADRALLGRVADLSPLLVPATRCVVGPAPAGRPALDLTAAAEIERLQGALARAKVAGRAGKTAEFEALARETLSAAETLAIAPLQAEAGLALGRALTELQRPRPAAAALFTAATAAEGAGLFSLAAECWLALAQATRDRTSADSEQWLTLADLAVQRAGAPADLVAQAKSERGFSLVMHGKLDGALALQRQATALLEARYGARDLRALSSSFRLATSLGMLGRCAEAEPLLRGVIAARSRALTATHPDTVDAVEALAICLHRSSRAEESLPLFKDVIAQREALLGTRSPRFASALSNYAGALDALGRYGEALVIAQRALSVRVEAFGENDPRIARQVQNVGIVQKKLGRHEEALASFRRARDLLEPSPGDGPFEGAFNRIEAAGALLELRRAAEALRELEPVDKLGAAQLAMVAGPLFMNRGLALLALGRQREAELALARAAAAPVSDINSADVVAHAKSQLAAAQRRGR